jgi:hypothetical protein
MSEETVEEIEREEIEMLLPWHATGKLDRADVAKVERYLADHPELLRQLELVRAEWEQTVAANEALGAPSAGAIDRLMAALPSARQGDSLRRASAKLFQGVGEFFTAPAAGAVRWAAVAVVAVVAVQAATIATLLLGDRGAGYQAASGREAGDGVLALVVFTDEATAAAISRLLAEFGANIVDGPKPGGVYKIRLRMEDRSQAAREARLRALAERRDIVRTVLPSRD